MPFKDVEIENMGNRVSSADAWPKLHRHGLVLKSKDPGAFNDLNYFSAVDFKRKEEPRFEKKKSDKQKKCCKSFLETKQRRHFLFLGFF